MLAHGSSVWCLHPTVRTARKLSTIQRNSLINIPGTRIILPVLILQYDSHSIFASYTWNSRGCGCLVVRYRLWGRRVPGSKPDSTEDPPSMGSVAR
ncbi:hypothetical protein AVEN_144648-1 [Araneus ventricosus]|uniref:Uncharacterized protein n=1 Tax=Araneus ventricosus TaxID=182803 RepID=A0A4Y2DZV3_ARAVE|nr:hypothetical protein AVEN_144648-1 [Araneus ventricosus]